MKQSVQLIAAPWAHPMRPSIQTAALKAFLKGAKIPELEVRSHSGHFWIPAIGGFDQLLPFFEHLEAREEFPYSLLLLRDFGASFKGKGRFSIHSLLREVNKKMKGPKYRSQSTVSIKTLDSLSLATTKFLEARVAPHLIENGVNVIGFSLNYHQVAASCYMMCYLKRNFPHLRFVFVAGGMSASVPAVIDLFRDLDLDVTCVLGEGEKKLEAICRGLSRLPKSADSTTIANAIDHCVQGVFASGTEKNLWVKDKGDFKNQIVDVSSLPLPDYDDYYAELRDFSADDYTYADLRGQTALLVEGSRGCFAACTFCGLNYMWTGFRKSKAETIVKNVRTMLARYNANNVFFVDNVCDTWAEAYADEIINSNTKVNTFMELRAHHPEIFWTKLSLAGVNWIQIGVEAVAPNVLKLIGKGTRVFQNVMVQKILSELGIKSLSNLILMYPDSTIEDVAETKRVIQATSHLQQFSTCRFALVLGSPLYNRIPEADRSRLKRIFPVVFPVSIRNFSLGFGYHPPRDWVSDDVRKAWTAFERWYDIFKKRNERDVPRLTVTRHLSGRLVVKDTRGRFVKEHWLDSDEARLLDLCHSGVRREYAQTALSLNPENFEAAVQSLVQKNILLELDGHYLSLPLRPRDELINNYYRAREAAISSQALTQASTTIGDELTRTGT